MSANSSSFKAEAITESTPISVYQRSYSQNVPLWPLQWVLVCGPFSFIIELFFCSAYVHIAQVLGKDWQDAGLPFGISQSNIQE
ncbi:hypothetical protein VNO77_24591 [Canavalia gladiata]|uniref:Uncharacterized protein n=1 Tax=Canavalia gladiata TaxID=3824 RepID=A0AAN9L945_CANGL